MLYLKDDLVQLPVASLGTLCSVLEAIRNFPCDFQTMGRITRLDGCAIFSLCNESVHFHNGNFKYFSGVISQVNLSHLLVNTIQCSAVDSVCPYPCQGL